MQYFLPENYQWVKEALIKEGRKDLIGYGPKCLIPPNPPKQASSKQTFSKNKPQKRHGGYRQK